jgi:hypothetical protein
MIIPYDNHQRRVYEIPREGMPNLISVWLNQDEIHRLNSPINPINNDHSMTIKSPINHI